MLGFVELVEEVNLNGFGKLFKIIGCVSFGKIVIIVVCGFNKLVIEEVECFIYDVLCVICCLVKKRVFIVGGGVLEIELVLWLIEYLWILSGMEFYCVCVFVDVMEVILFILVENVGLNFIFIVIELRNWYV